MTQKFIPRWKDSQGNIALFPYKDGVFDTHDEALEFQNSKFIDLMCVGFSSAGIHEFEENASGEMDIAHVKFSRDIFKGILIEGPEFDKVVESTEKKDD